MFDKILKKIVYGSLNQESLDTFCKRDIKTFSNKTGRSNPRRSNTPFTKWYVKDYSESAKYKKVINAIINNTINKLNKNLKSLAKRITIIDYG
jgi:spore germination protein GerM